LKEWRKRSEGESNGTGREEGTEDSRDCKMMVVREEGGQDVDINQIGRISEEKMKARSQEATE
jgi:hypothetical protein